MKLVSLNLEGKRHLDKALPFLESESPDIISLLEAPEDLTFWLKDRQYETTFAPMTIRTQSGEVFTEGVIVASKTPQLTEVFYYHKRTPEPVHYVHDDKRGTIAHPVLFSTINTLRLATTHFTWNPVGEVADENQIHDMEALLSYLNTQPSHIFCGDLNIPRHHNHLYDLLIRHYQDAIPESYASSLDRNLHRVGSVPELSKLFDSFMVDYVFTQPPFTATDTRLQFGVSDHAAVVTTFGVQ